MAPHKGSSSWAIRGRLQSLKTHQSASPAQHQIFSINPLIHHIHTNHFHHQSTHPSITTSTHPPTNNHPSSINPQSMFLAATVMLTFPIYNRYQHLHHLLLFHHLRLLLLQLRLLLLLLLLRCHLHPHPPPPPLSFHLHHKYFWLLQSHQAT